MRFINSLVQSLAIVLVLQFSGCTTKEKEQRANALINETSPYLLQHANNPVYWYPWGEEALDKAQREEKLMVISIGYAACHWCHVMEHESYEDSTVAAVMNEHYVSIKIDREERPDIDQVYIEAAQLMSGNAGWPLNVIALSDGTPVFTGTYFPRNQWLQVLKRIQDIYEKDPQRLKDQASRVMANLKAYNDELAVSNRAISGEDFEKAMSAWLASMDSEKGGVVAAQKFPLPGSYLQLINYGLLRESPQALEAVELVMDKMATRGLYDHISAGWHRYTVDDKWEVPHFEKMLYDNAQMLSLYSIGYQVFRKPLYQRVVEETIDFLASEMRDADGGFYASFDADSEGEEGKFYVWTSDEIDAVLDNAEAFKSFFEITKVGNWEDGKNVLLANSDVGEFPGLMKQLEKLREVRSERVSPLRDDKVLTSWNALMVKGLVDAYNAFGNERYLELAKETAAFIRDQQTDEQGRIFRNFKDGKSTINGFLDDYAFTIQSYLALYEATFDKQWLDEAHLLTSYVQEHFFDQQRSLFRYKSDKDPNLIVSKYGVSDNVTPSGNAVMASNLFTLGTLYYDSHADFLTQAETMMKRITDGFSESANFYYAWLPRLLAEQYGFYEVAIVGPEFTSMRKALLSHYSPLAIYMGGNEENLPLLQNKLVPGKTFIYVCREKYCKLPSRTVEEALKQLAE